MVRAGARSALRTGAGGIAIRRAAAVVICVLMPWRIVEAQPALRTRVQVSGLTSPLAVVQDPTDRSVQFVVQQGGRIRVVRAGAIADRDFIDLSATIVSGGEQGLLGLVFPP